MTDPQPTTETAVTRSEWIAGAAFLLSAASMIWTGGVIYGQVQEHDRRIVAVESKLDSIVPRIERIDANVTILAERAAEDRKERGGK
jgi:hypothetical protein